MSPSEAFAQLPAGASNRFTGDDVAAILREHGWLRRDAAAPETQAWVKEAAALLGPHCETREALAHLLSLVFHYDATAILRAPESHIVVSREGAREVIRELAHLVLAGPAVNSARFKEIIAALKERLRYRGRALFHPIRLALAGRAGEGALDRVILLLDPASQLEFVVPVKGVATRMVEFCAALD